jgi:hypothetical protein
MIIKGAKIVIFCFGGNFLVFFYEKGEDSPEEDFVL